MIDTIYDVLTLYALCSSCVFVGLMGYSAIYYETTQMPSDKFISIILWWPLWLLKVLVKTLLLAIKS